MKMYRVVVSYLVQMEQVVEYTVEAEDESNLRSIPFLDEYAIETEVLEFSQVSEPYDPEIIEVEEIKIN
jgi:hypothetical protein